MSKSESIDEKMIQWAQMNLNDPVIRIEKIVKTPWSSVFKILTHKDSFYLKKTPSQLLIEVDVIKILRETCHIENIPEVINSNASLNCFLMRSYGDVSLRTLFKESIIIDKVFDSLKIYRKIQSATVPYISDFMKVEVPDWRLEQFPQLYEDLIKDTEYLIKQNLNESQIQVLNSLTSTIDNLCNELSEYGISESLNHSDFHENNILFSFST